MSTAKATVNYIKSEGCEQSPNEGSGEVREQVPWRHRQRTSQFDYVFQGDVPLPSLNPADIVAMQPSSFSQFLLRVPALVAELSQ
jgi:hypothetical protein